jgi:hypothetical protein
MECGGLPPLFRHPNSFIRKKKVVGGCRQGVEISPSPSILCPVKTLIQTPQQAKLLRINTCENVR